jgi:hypothetical protein
MYSERGSPDYPGCSFRRPAGASPRLDPHLGIDHRPEDRHGLHRSGTDGIKALAIGAKAVLVGRPPLWGLAAFGAAGVQRVMEMLQTELALAMGL